MKTFDRNVTFNKRTVETHDMWHVTGDIWHVTRDMWHRTHDRWGELNLLSKVQPNRLLKIFLQKMTYGLTHWPNHECICSPALATQGLLNISVSTAIHYALYFLVLDLFVSYFSEIYFKCYILSCNGPALVYFLCLADPGEARGCSTNTFVIISFIHSFIH